LESLTDRIYCIYRSYHIIERYLLQLRGEARVNNSD